LQGSTASSQGATATIQSISGTDAGGSNANNDSGLQFIVTNGGSATENTAMTINTSGRVLVGTSTARDNFLNASGTYVPQFQIEGTTFNGSSMSLVRNANSASDNYLIFGKTRGTTVGSNTVVASNDGVGGISFQGADGSELVEAAVIKAEIDGTPGANDMPGRLVFLTTADGASSPTTRMIIKNNGNILIGTTTAIGALIDCESWGFNIKVGQIWNHTTSIPSGGAAEVIGFSYQGATVGKISITTTATTYSTSSDYRLKENVIAITNGITRLQQLKPSRFNFIADPAQTFDGFIAHEVQTVVPEAITGEKDEVDDDGNPQYQGIDQSKLVPLLTAALQEAIGRIETLESEVAALKAQ